MSGEPERAGLFVAVAAALVAAAPSVARAQACCAAPSLVAPSRLARSESGAVGVQARGRGVFGSFASDGSFARTSSGDLEAAQDLFGSLRVFRHAQVALLVPFVETRRRAAGLSDVGGGLGDLRLAAHVELLRAGERRFVPGLALVMGGALPTGTAPEDATGLLAADATGTGSYEGSVGLEVDQRFERAFVVFGGGVGRRTGRAVGGVQQSFGPRFTALATGGLVLDNDLTLGAFVSALHQGAARDEATGAAMPGSALSLVTAGVGATLPVGEVWRGHAALSADCPVSGLGRNQSAGAGLTVSVLRVWP
jgi:hypothetical protein